MDRRLAAWLAITPVIGCNARPVEPDRECVSIRVLDLDPLVITPSGMLLEQPEDGGPLLVRRLHADGSVSEVATLEGVTLDPDVSSDLRGSDASGSFAHDPTTGRMWLVVHDTWPRDEPALVYQFDATGKLEWQREVVHEGRFSPFGSVLEHEGAVYVAGTLEPLDPFDPSDPDDEPEWNSLVIQRLDHAGQLVWARANYPWSHDGEFASAGGMSMGDAGLSLVGGPPIIDWGSSAPFVVDVNDGALVWVGEHRYRPDSLARGDLLAVVWADPPMTPGGSVNYHEVPHHSVLNVHGANGELRATSQVEWPTEEVGATTLAFLGPRIVTLVTTEGPLGVAVHGSDGATACMDVVDELGDVRLRSAIGLDEREQIAVIAMVGLEEEVERRLLLLGPGPDLD